MEDTSKANIVFNISGGNNQILPNAIKAEQNFYGDKYMEEMMKAKTTSQEPVLSPETTRLSLYINNVEALAEYVAKLSACTNAKELAQVVMDMVNDTDVKVDQDIFEGLNITKIKNFPNPAIVASLNTLFHLDFTTTKEIDSRGSVRKIERGNVELAVSVRILGHYEFGTLKNS